MLCLKNDSNPDWIEIALKNFDSVMIDHAHAEKKAAFTALNLINSYPEKTELSLAMADLIEEEIDHYRSVVKLLNQKDLTLTADKGDDYVKKLFSQLRKNQPARFLDHLLIAGIIEARSCERLKILAENVQEKSLAQFYKLLCETEARHYMTFIKLAKKYFPESDVLQRLDELCKYEAEIVSKLKNEPLMHG